MNSQTIVGMTGVFILIAGLIFLVFFLIDKFGEKKDVKRFKELKLKENMKNDIYKEEIRDRPITSADPSSESSGLFRNFFGGAIGSGRRSDNKAESTYGERSRRLNYIRGDNEIAEQRILPSEPVKSVEPIKREPKWDWNDIKQNRRA